MILTDEEYDWQDQTERIYTDCFKKDIKKRFKKRKTRVSLVETKDRNLNMQRTTHAELVVSIFK